MRECERRGAAADDESLLEPSVSAQEYGGAAAAAPQPPAAGQPPEARPEIAAADHWEPAAGGRCEARFQASATSALYLWQRPWCPGVIKAVDKDARTCDVDYDDGDHESGVLFKYVRPEPPPAGRSDSVVPAMEGRD